MLQMTRRTKLTLLTKVCDKSAAMQRMTLSQNSSFTGADNPENKTAKPGSSRDKRAGSLYERLGNSKYE